MRKKQVERLIISAFAIIIFALGLGARMIDKSMHFTLLDKLNQYAWIASGLIFVLLIVLFLFENRIYKGFRYSWNYWMIKNRLQLQMIDAGFGIQRSYFVELPRIRLSFSDDLTSGELRIKNALKYNRKLDDVIMNSALGKFIVEQHYQTDDGNYYVYELIDGTVSFKMTFDTFGDFLKHNKTIPTYKLFLDKRSVVKVSHFLIVGITGSGKTYLLYSLIMQMNQKSIPFQVFYADPKGSSLAVLGSAISEKRTGIDVDRIIELLEEFVKLMRERKTELKKRLQKGKLDSDYATFSMSPYIFICDEYASFATAVQSLEKKRRDDVKALLYEVILQGRQLGFFLFMLLQKSDATIIDTALRENLQTKIILGNSGQMTYTTALGTGVDIPNRHYMVGEGVFTEPEIAPEPKLVQCPYFKFDILQACTQARVM